MNILFVPAAAALGVAALSFLTHFLAPPLLVAIIPPQPAPSNTDNAGGVHYYCEGYYPPIEDCLPLGTTRPPWWKKNRSNANCPQGQISDNWSRWGEKDAFVSKLQDIESTAKEYEDFLTEELTSDDVTKLGGTEGLKPLVWIRRERGVAWSRIQESIIAGNSEFHSDTNGGESSIKEDEGGSGGDHGSHHVCWTDALLPMYVKEFGVKPSKEFILFVNNFDLTGFKEQLSAKRKQLLVQSTTN